MKIDVILVATVFAMALAPCTAFGKGSHAVHSYTKKDGTHVDSHRATDPDKSKRNNYSSKGNVNPNTGKAGTKDPDKK